MENAPRFSGKNVRDTVDIESQPRNSRRRSPSREMRRRHRDRSRSRESHREDRSFRDYRSRERNGANQRQMDNRSGSRETRQRRRDSPRRRRRSRSPLDTYFEGRSDCFSDAERSLTAQRGHPTGKDARAIVQSKSEMENDVNPDLNIDNNAIRSVMGFSGFRSTKNTKVPGNNIGAVRKNKEIKARQYMNRVGGFNRPLSPGR